MHERANTFASHIDNQRASEVMDATPASPHTEVSAEGRYFPPALLLQPAPEASA